MCRERGRGRECVCLCVRVCARGCHCVSVCSCVAQVLLVRLPNHSYVQISGTPLSGVGVTRPTLLAAPPAQQQQHVGGASSTCAQLRMRKLPRFRIMHCDSFMRKAGMPRSHPLGASSNPSKSHARLLILRIFFSQGTSRYRRQIDPDSAARSKRLCLPKRFRGEVNHRPRKPRAAAESAGWTKRDHAFQAHRLNER